MFSCGVTFFRVDRETRKHGCTHSMFQRLFFVILYSSQNRNIHVHVCVYIHTYIQILFTYVYINIHILLYDRVWLAWPCQGLKPARLAEACHEANEAPKPTSGGPRRCGAAVRRKAGPCRGAMGTARPGLPPSPRFTVRRAWGTPGACRELGPPRHLRHLRSSWHFLCILVIA